METELPRITARDIVRPFVAFALGARPEDRDIVSYAEDGTEKARLRREDFALAATFYLESVEHHSPELLAAFKDLPPIEQNLPDLIVRTYPQVPARIWAWLLAFLLLGIAIGWML